MLGLSLGKLLVLAALILIAWYGLKYVQRVDDVRRAVRRETGARRAGAHPARGTTLAAEDLAPCERCGAYVAARGAASCGRADCPWGR